MKHFISIFLVLTAFVVSPFFSSAQDTEGTLEKVVVTATRDVEEIRKIPASVTVVTKERIEQSKARNGVYLSRNEADIEVRDIYGNGKSASVDIRGFGETGP